MSTAVDLEPSWLERLASEFQQPYFAELRDFLKQEKQKRKVIYPPGPLIFRAFSLTPFDAVEVVILGQDPYHGPNQAEGLCFSVPMGQRLPPSLQNIYREMARDFDLSSEQEARLYQSGSLERWARQGVFLLNAVLTVEARHAASHQSKGWEQFTDRVIRLLNEERTNLVFMLWGSYAQQKAALLDSRKHLILKATHPSPFSAHLGFIGCGHFSKANQYLAAHGKRPISWVE